MNITYIWQTFLSKVTCNLKKHHSVRTEEDSTHYTFYSLDKNMQCSTKYKRVQRAPYSKQNTIVNMFFDFDSEHRSRQTIFDSKSVYSLLPVSTQEIYWIFLHLYVSAF